MPYQITITLNGATFVEGKVAAVKGAPGLRQVGQHTVPVENIAFVTDSHVAITGPMSHTFVATKLIEKDGKLQIETEDGSKLTINRSCPGITIAIEVLVEEEEEEEAPKARGKGKGKKAAPKGKAKPKAKGKKGSVDFNEFLVDDDDDDDDE